MKMKKDATNPSSYKRKIYKRQGNVSVVRMRRRRKAKRMRRRTRRIVMMKRRNNEE